MVVVLCCGPPGRLRARCLVARGAGLVRSARCVLPRALCARCVSCSWCSWCSCVLSALSVLSAWCAWCGWSCVWFFA